MGKKIVTGIISVLVLSGAGYLLVSNNDQKIAQIVEVQNTEPVTTEQNTSENKNPGEYVDYDAEVLASTIGRRVLFFHAPWCPQCNDLDKSIKNGVIPDGVTIFKTDYDSNQELRQQYGVTLQTTLVLLDDQGNLAKKYVSYEEPNLEAVIKNLLQ